MNMWKRLTALLLSAVCLCTLFVVPPAAAAETVSTFPDVTDPLVGRAVEVLRTMGIVDGGDGGSYFPDNSLTRAQFCKLAIETMGRGGEVDAYTTRTIFPDVTSTHWARGYVNLAAAITVGGEESGSRLMIGVGDGTFAPDRAITYGEAATILLRILGYTSAANSSWPTGAMTTAASIGLSAGLSVADPYEELNRGQAAILFYNMLTAPVNGSADVYAASLGRVEKDLLLLACNTTADNGREGAVSLFSPESGESRVLAAVHTPAGFLQGSRGTAIFNHDGLFLTFLPDPNAVSRVIVTESAAAGTTGVLTAADGSRITLSPSTTVWYSGEKKTYSQVYTSLNRVGVTVTVCYGATGAVDYLYVGSVAASGVSGGVMVAKDEIVGNPFAELTGGATGYTILKDGVQATVSDIQRYDVGVFDAATNVLTVSGFRVTGVYEGARPNATMPTQIKVFGQWLPVLESAIDDLQKFKTGDLFTLLFTADGQVAGAVAVSETHASMVGLVDPSKSSDSSVTVDLIGVPEAVSSITAAFTGSADSYLSTLVSVTVQADGSVRLSRLTGGAAAPLNVRARTVGDAPLAENAYLFERVGGGAPQAIKLSDITVDTVAASKILYQRTNAAGKVDILVLDDVTGDLYTYGIAKIGDTGRQDFNGTYYTNPTVTVTNGSVSRTTVGGSSFKDGQFIGLAASLSELDGYPRTAASVALKSVTGVNAGNFNLESGRFFSGSLELPIWDEVQCYNAKSKTWFADSEKTALENLSDCLAYSDNLTVYYDRNPNQGGKVRIVVAN